MTQLNVQQTLANYLLENHDIALKDKSISIDGFPVSGVNRGRALLKIFSRKTLMSLDLPSLYGLEQDEYRREIGDLSPVVIDITRRALEEKLKKEQLEGVEVDLNLSSAPENLLPVVELDSPKGDYFMVHKSTLRVNLTTYNSWSKIVTPEHRKTAESLRLGGVKVYKPLSNKAVDDITVPDLGTVKEYNVYHPPAWKYERDKSVVLDLRFKKFFETLFTTKSSLQYAIDWCYYSCHQKLETYMVMRGDGGIGKELFSKAMEILVHPNNYTKVGSSVLSKGNKFNGHLLYKTLCFYDECSFREQHAKSKLKDWANSKTPVELKGVDQRMEDNFASGIIATNNVSDCYIECNDRKFSVMDMTEKTMDQRLGKEDRIFCWQYLRSPEFCQAFYNYLEENKDDNFKENEPFHGDTYKHLLFATLRDWQTVIIDKIKSRADKLYPVDDIKEQAAISRLGYNIIKDFLASFRPENDERMGSIVKFEGRLYIQPTDRYLPESDDL